jgi:hypothetical protein
MFGFMCYLIVPVGISTNISVILWSPNFNNNNNNNKQKKARKGKGMNRGKNKWWEI